MRTDQRRYFGHPDLLAFIQRLSSRANQKALGTVLIGDMAMPAGGRFSSGTPATSRGSTSTSGCSCRANAGARSNC